MFSLFGKRSGKVKQVPTTLRKRRGRQARRATFQNSALRHMSLEPLEDRRVLASIVGLAGNTVSLSDSVGEANTVTMQFSGSTLTLTDLAGIAFAPGAAGADLMTAGGMISGGNTLTIDLSPPAVTDISIDTGALNDTILIEETPDLFTLPSFSGITTVNGGIGNDAVGLGRLGFVGPNSLQGFQTPISVNGGGGMDILQVADGNGVADATVTISPNSISGIAPTSISYFDFDQLDVDTYDLAAVTVNVAGLSADTVIDTADGANDVVNISVAAATSGLNASVFTGAGDSDTLNIDAGNFNVTTNAGSATVSGSSTFYFDGADLTTLFGGPNVSAELETLEIANAFEVTALGGATGDTLTLYADSGMFNAHFLLDTDILNSATTDDVVRRIDANSFQFLAGDGVDQLIFDDASGLPAFVGAATGSHVSGSFTTATGFAAGNIGVHYDGGGDFDALAINTPNTVATTYYHSSIQDGDDANGENDGNVGISGGFALSFSGLEPVDFLGGGGSLVVDASDTPATTFLHIDDDAAFPGGTPLGFFFGAPMPNDGVTGIVGDGGFENARFGNYSSVTVRSGSGAEAILLEGLDVGSGNVQLPVGPSPLIAIDLNASDLSGADNSLDQISVARLPTTVSATLYGGDANDVFDVGGWSPFLTPLTPNNPNPLTMDGVLGAVNVFGESNTATPTATAQASANGPSLTVTLPVGDTLNVLDENSAGGQYVVNDGSIQVTRPGPINLGLITHMTVETVNVFGSLAGVNDIDVVNTTAAATTNIASGDAGDAIDVTRTGDGSILRVFSAGGSDVIGVALTGANSAVEIYGQGGADTVTVSDTGANSALLIVADDVAPALTPGADVITIDDTGAGSVSQLSGGELNDLFDINGTDAASFVAVAGDSGTDTLRVDAGARNVTTDAASVTVTGDAAIQFGAPGASIETLEIHNALEVTAVGGGANDELALVGDSGLFNAQFLLDSDTGTASPDTDDILRRIDAGSFRFLAGTGNDHLLIDGNPGGLPAFLGMASSSHANASFLAETGLTAADVGIQFAGEGGADVFSLVLANGDTSTTYYHSDLTLPGNSGNVGVLGAGPFFAMSFTGLAPVEFVGGGGELVVDATSTPATTFLHIDDDAAFPAPTFAPFGVFGAPTADDGVTGIVGNGGFENARFGNFATLTVRSGADLAGETILLEDLDTGGGVLNGVLPGPNPLAILNLDGDDLAGTDAATDHLAAARLPLNGFGAPIALNLRGGGGNDAFEVGGWTTFFLGGPPTPNAASPNTLDGIPGSVAIDGEANLPAPTLSVNVNALSGTATANNPLGDVVSLIDSLDFNDNSYQIAPTAVTRTAAGPAVTVTTANTESLRLSGGAGASAVTVAGTAASSNTFITTQESADLINVISTGSASYLNVASNGGGDAIDIAATGAMSLTQIFSGSGGDTIDVATTGGSAGLSVQAGDGNDFFSVLNTGAGSVTRLEGGNHDDTLNALATIGAGSFLEMFGEGGADRATFGAGTLDTLGATDRLSFQGGPGTDQLIVDDSGDTNANVYQILPDRVTRSTVAPAVTIHYATVENVQLLAGIGVDVLNARPSADARYDLDGGAPTRLPGTPGPGVGDRLNVDLAGLGPAGGSFALTSGTILSTSGAFEPLSYQEIEEGILGEVTGVTYEDANRNRQFDAPEAATGGFVVELRDANGERVTAPVTSAPDGTFAFVDVPPLQNYTVRQVPRDGWQQSTPSFQGFAVRLDIGGVRDDLEFGDAPVDLFTPLVTDSFVSDVVAADFDGNGFGDVLVVNDVQFDSQGSSLTIFHAGATPGIFNGAVVTIDLPAGARPQQVVVGNFDAGPTVDIAVALLENFNDPTSGAVMILSNDGAGGFAPTQTFRSLGGPTELAAGDFNGDGVTDLAVGALRADNVVLLTGQGDGTFSEHSRVALSGSPAALAVSDWNRDGIDDLAVAVHLQQGLVALFNGTAGGFQISRTWQGFNLPSGLAAKDVDGDGAAELAVADYGNDQVAILSRSGGAWQEVRLPVSNPISVGFGDLQQDGFQELVAGGDQLATFTFFDGRWLPGGTRALPNFNVGDEVAGASSRATWVGEIDGLDGDEVLTGHFLGGGSLGANFVADAYSAAPLAAADAFEVDGAEQLDVLANDFLSPIAGELRIDQVNDPTGVVSISPDRKSLFYNGNSTAGSLTFTYVAIGFNDLTSQATVQLTINASAEGPSPLQGESGQASDGEGAAAARGSAWQNPQNPLDVDAVDGVTTADLLALVADVLLNGARELPNTPVGALFLDVNGDRFLTTEDVLEVLSSLILTHNGEGEGEMSLAAEQVFAAPDATTTPATAPATESALTAADEITAPPNWWRTDDGRRSATSHTSGASGSRGSTRADAADQFFLTLGELDK